MPDVLPHPPTDLADRLERLLDRLMTSPRIPHALVAVERGDRSFRWAAARGPAAPGGAPMGADTPFFIASIDKLLTAVVVLKIVERRRLTLEDRISTVLPAPVAGRLHVLHGVDHTPQITIRHLLSHTSGLPDWLEDRPRGGRSVVDAIVADGDRSWSLDEVAGHVRDRLAPHFPPQPLDGRRPRARYSDTNFVLLQAVIETVTGEPVHQVFDDLLFRPLDLRQTFLPGHTGPAAGTPPGAALWFGDRPVHIPQLLRSINGVYATADDLLRLLRAVTTGTVFADPATWDVMRGRWVRFGVPRDRAALRAPGWPIEYALGLMRFQLPRWLTPLRRVPAVVGHTGSTGCWLFWCPDLDLYLTGTVDQGTAGAVPFRIVPKLLGLLAG